MQTGSGGAKSMNVFVNWLPATRTGGTVTGKMVKWAAVFFFLMLLAGPASASHLGDQWRIILGDFTNEIYGEALFTNGNYIYSVGGQDASALIPFIIRSDGYNAGTMVNGSSFARAYAAYAAFDNKYWIMGGYNSTTLTKYMDANDTWMSTDLVIFNRVNGSCTWAPREKAAAVVYDGKLWMTGGYNRTSLTTLSDVWFLTTANETPPMWTKATDSAAFGPRYGHNMFVLNGKMWVVGGGSGTAYSSTDGATWTLEATDTNLNKNGTALGMVNYPNPEVVMRGGFNLNTNANTRDVLVTSDGITWTLVNITTSIPAAAGPYTRMINFTPAASTTLKWAGVDSLYLVAFDGALAWTSLYTAVPVKQAFSVPTGTSGTAPFPVSWGDTSMYGYADSWAWDFKDGYLSNVENASHTFAAPGTYNVEFITISLFGTSVSANLTTITVTSSQSQINYYTQKQVRLKAVDAAGDPLAGVTIRANYTASSLPSTDITWLVSAFGVSAEVAQQMTNSSLAMTGVTAGDGSLTFVMFPSITYRLELTNATIGLSTVTSISPQDSDYTIYSTLPSQKAQNSTYMPGHLWNTTLFITEPTANTVTFNLIYYDPSGLTTSLDFNVTCWDNKTPMYYITVAPGSAVYLNDAYTVPNVKGQEWRFWYNASRSAPL